VLAPLAAGSRTRSTAHMFKVSAHTCSSGRATHDTHHMVQQGPGSATGSSHHPPPSYQHQAPLPAPTRQPKEQSQGGPSVEPPLNPPLDHAITQSLPGSAGLGQDSHGAGTVLHCRTVRVAAMKINRHHPANSMYTLHCKAAQHLPRPAHTTCTFGSPHPTEPGAHLQWHSSGGHTSGPGHSSSQATTTACLSSRLAGLARGPTPLLHIHLQHRHASAQAYRPNQSLQQARTRTRTHPNCSCLHSTLQSPLITCRLGQVQSVASDAVSPAAAGCTPTPTLPQSPARHTPVRNLTRACL